MPTYDLSREQLLSALQNMRKKIAQLEKQEEQLKKAADETEKGRLQLATLLNGIPDMVWMKDKEGRYLIVNDSFAKTAGVDVDSLVGMSDFDIWPSKIAEQHISEDHEVMRSREVRTVGELLVTGKGDKLWIETTRAPIVDDKSEAVGTTGVARDITALILTEEALKESEERCRDLADLLPQPIIELDADDTVAFANKAALNAFGYARKDLRENISFFNIIAPEFVDELKSNFDKLKAGRKVGKIECSALRKDGTDFSAEIYGSAVKKGDHPPGMRLFVVDTADRKRLEEEARKARQ